MKKTKMQTITIDQESADASVITVTQEDTTTTATAISTVVGTGTGIIPISSVVYANPHLTATEGMEQEFAYYVASIVDDSKKSKSTVIPKDVPLHVKTICSPATVCFTRTLYVGDDLACENIGHSAKESSLRKWSSIPDDFAQKYSYRSVLVNNKQQKERVLDQQLVCRDCPHYDQQRSPCSKYMLVFGFAHIHGDNRLGALGQIAIPNMSTGAFLGKITDLGYMQYGTGMVMDAFLNLPLPIEFEVTSTGKTLVFTNMKIWEGLDVPGYFPKVIRQSRYGKVCLSEEQIEVKAICEFAKKQVNQQLIERVA
jgi:hypothetical protein